MDRETLARLIAAITVAIGLILLWLFLLGPRAASEDAIRLTWYGEDFRGGPLYCSGDPYDPDNPGVAATKQVDWVCGDVLEVCGTSCITVTVIDRCGGCTPGRHIDLSRAAWEAAGGVDYGTVRKVDRESPKPQATLEKTVTELPKTGIGGK